MSTTHEWRLDGDLDEVGRVVAELQARVAPVLGKGAHDLALAVEELLANAVIHGRELCGRKPRLTVSCATDGGAVRVEVRDDCPAFNPCNATAPNLELPLDERPPGGLGVHLVFTLVDTVEYERQGGENVVVITRKARDEAAARKVDPGVQ